MRVNRIPWKLIVLCTFITMIIIFSRERNSIQTITYFPIDPTATFLYAETKMTNVKKTGKNQYSLLWRIESMLDQNAYLRQDIGLLYANGRLVAKANKWQENVDVIFQEQKLIEEGAKLLQAISFHQAELHRNHEHISSAQKESKDEEYIVPTSNSVLTFKQPKTKEQAHIKNDLDQMINSELVESWKSGLKTFHIDQNKYTSFPLTSLSEFETKPIPGFSKQKTEQIIGRLWEGLYKNYFLGIKTRNGTIVNPISSTIPLILIANDHTHILVIFQTQDQESVLLRQNIPND